MSKVFKAVKKILPVALPVAASFIPGIGPLGMAAAGALGGAAGGGGLKGALIGGALSGLGGGMFGAAPGTTGIGAIDSLNSGMYNAMSPLQTIGTSIKTGLGDLLPPLKGLFGGATSSMTPGVADATLKQSFPNVAAQNAARAAAGLSPVAKSAATAAANGGGGLFGTGIGMPEIVLGASLLSELNPDKGGMLNQREIVARMDADRAKQDAENSRFIGALNSSPLQRNQTQSNIDYYNYGYRPEVQFFDDASGGQAKFARGGKVKKASSPLAAMGGQDDTIDARLSAGEYVIPADVVSGLGDGNTEAGASKLDQLLAKIRKQKAPAMKKGSLPPRAKSPLAYMGATA